jgi:hypothetical protein
VVRDGGSQAAREPAEVTIYTGTVETPPGARGPNDVIDHPIAQFVDADAGWGSRLWGTKVASGGEYWIPTNVNWIREWSEDYDYLLQQTTVTTVSFSRDEGWGPSALRISVNPNDASRGTISIYDAKATLVEQPYPLRPTEVSQWTCWRWVLPASSLLATFEYGHKGLVATSPDSSYMRMLWHRDLGRAMVAAAEELSADNSGLPSGVRPLDAGSARERDEPSSGGGSGGGGRGNPPANDGPRFDVTSWQNSLGSIADRWHFEVKQPSSWHLLDWVADNLMQLTALDGRPLSEYLTAEQVRLLKHSMGNGRLALDGIWRAMGWLNARSRHFEVVR